MKIKWHFKIMMLNQMVYLFFKDLNMQNNLKNSGKLQC